MLTKCYNILFLMDSLELDTYLNKIIKYIICVLIQNTKFYVHKLSLLYYNKLK